MSEIEIIKVDPLELPWKIVWEISGLHHITPKDFYVYVQEVEGKMYVNKSVPEKDIEKMIEVATFPGRYILDDKTEMGQFMCYIYETYGYPAYSAILKCHEYRMEQQDKQRVKEKVRSAIPSIEKMIKVGMIDEYMIHETYKAGADREGRTSKNICGFHTVYPYCLGYLVGSGILKEDCLKNEENPISCYDKILELLERTEMWEMPKIYGYLKEMCFSEDAQEGDTHE